MSWVSLIDTILNVVVFAFLGLLIWLYFKPMAGEKSDEEN
jgi:hypothetical protein